MCRTRIVVSALLILFAASLIFAQDAAHERQRVIVLTDISNEPDDEESMVRLAVREEAGRGRHAPVNRENEEKVNDLGHQRGLTKPVLNGHD